MPTSQQTEHRRVVALAVLPAVFFAFIYLYVWLRVDPRLIYHRQCPLFMIGSVFFERFLDHPGGLVEYLSGLLAQGYTHPWAGALIITSAAGLICMATRSFITKMGGTRIEVLYLVPAIFLLVLHNRYDYPLACDVGLLLALLFLNVYIRVLPGRPALRFIAFALLSAVLYYGAAGPCVLFMLLCGLFELLTREQLYLGLLYLLLVPVAPYVAGRFVFDVDLIGAYAHLSPFHPSVAPSMASLVLYGFFPFVAILVPLGQRAAAEATPAADTSSPSLPASALESHGKGRFQWAYHSLVLLAAAVAAAFFSFDSHGRSLLRIDYWARHRMWRPLLREARRLPADRYQLTTLWDVNRALFHTGRLPDEMFSYPQRPAARPEGASSLMCSHSTAGTDVLPLAAKPILGDVFFDLGRLGEAEFRANEALVWFGDRPATIERLFLIHLIKGESDPAATFLNALSKHLLWRDRVRDYRRRLKEDPLLTKDESMKHIRSIMIEKDQLGAVPVETMLQQLLERNRRNRMAFEYLMAHYLLTRQVEKIALNLDRLDDFEYSGIPRHYAEAILLYLRAGRNRDVDLHGRQISPDARRRFEAFMEVYQRYKDNRQAAQKALVGDYADSYLFYYMFGFSGPGRVLTESLPDPGVR